ncbi:pentatricopeptide repeat-containing protein, putative [Ricinus communis]|uniref:Pentatricopeptide repeat-containing protein, putative n=1 Tax=Ricinus communis TaxID=3988 RepID=B9RQU3_RICCO|nr:pentatricopeptide repeat-containing protein, putative [Ricinus communis]
MATAANMLTHRLQTPYLTSVVTAITTCLRSLNPQNLNPSHINPAPLNQFSPYLNSQLVIEVIRKQSNPYHALFFFNWASNLCPNPNNYFHNHHCYVAITDLLLSHSLFALASSLLQNANKMSDLMVSKFIIAYGNLKEVKRAIFWFDKAKAIGNVNANRFNIAQSIFDEMVAVKPDVSTYAIMIKGYWKMRSVENASKLFDEMSCEPNLGNVDEARKLMTEMRLNGLKENLATHMSILKGLCYAGKSDEAVNYFKEMIRKGMKCDVKAYAVVINEYCKMKKPNEAIALLKEMKAKGINPSVSSFNAVIQILMKLGEPDAAIFLLKQMQGMGCRPNFISYNIVIGGLCGAKGRMQNVKELLHNMLCSGLAVDATMYSSLVKGYCEDGNEEMAKQVLYEAIDNNYVIDSESFSVFANKMCEKGKAVGVENILKEMCKRCSVVDVGNYWRILDEQLAMHLAKGS